MTEVVNAPLDGEGVTVTYSVNVGDVVEVDQLIAEIESDKATVEVTAPSEGVITALHLEAGKEVDVTMDTAVATIVSKDQPAPAEAAAPTMKSKTQTSERIVTTAPVDADEVSFKYIAKPGDTVKEGDVVATSLKGGQEQQIIAPADGQLSSFYIDELDAVDVQAGKTRLFSIDTGKSGKKAPAASPAATAPAAAAKPAEDLGSQTVALSRHQLAMIQNMTVQGGDTIPFVLQEVVDFNRVSSIAKMANVSPLSVLLRCLAEAVQET